MKTVMLENGVHEALVRVRDSQTHRDWLHENFPLRRATMQTAIAFLCESAGEMLSLEDLPPSQKPGPRCKYGFDTFEPGEVRIMRMRGPNIDDALKRHNKRGGYKLAMDPTCEPRPHPITGQVDYWVKVWRTDDVKYAD